MRTGTSSAKAVLVFWSLGVRTSMSSIKTVLVFWSLGGLFSHLSALTGFSSRHMPNTHK